MRAVIRDDDSALLRRRGEQERKEQRGRKECRREEAREERVQELVGHVA